MTWFVTVLSGFVAVNTVLYVTLAIFKILPKIYVSDWFSGANRRRETRNINPDSPL